MIGDVRFQMPSLEGVDVADPTQLQDYLGSFGAAVAEAFRQIAVQMNDATRILVPGAGGMRPLSDVASETGAKPGDLKATVASRGTALGQEGWVPCDGYNGTPNTVNAFVLGAEEATNPGLEVVGSADVETSSPTPTETDESPDRYTVLDGCDGVEVSAIEHVHEYDHTHTVGVASYVKSFSVLWMMKL